MAYVIVCPSGSVELAPKLKLVDAASLIVNATADTIGAEFTGFKVIETVPAALCTVPS